MPFRSGSEDSETYSKSFSSNRLQFLTFKDDGETHIIRFIDEHTKWPVVDVHIQIPTKEIPANRKKAGMKWPDKMGATCQNDQGFRIPGPDGNASDEWEDGYGRCYIHEHYADKMNQWNRPLSAPVTSTFARVVVREKTPQGIRDKQEEWIDPQGNKHMVPMIRVISQQWGKFFSGIKAGAFEDGSVVTKDFTVKKSGKDFTIATLSITPDHKPGTESWQRYLDAAALIGADLEGLIRHQADKDWYQTWWIPGPWDEEPLESEQAGAGTEVGTAASPDGDLSASEQEQMTELRKRLLDQRGARADA
jgi:hypothetical protein